MKSLIKGGKLAKLTLFHLSLLVTYLSDISTVDGKTIYPTFWVVNQTPWKNTGPTNIEHKKSYGKTAKHPFKQPTTSTPAPRTKDFQLQ